MSLLPNEVTTITIAPGAVTTAKIAAGAVNSAQLADKSVTTAKIANRAVTAYKIGKQQVTTSRLKDAAVTTPKIAVGAVGTRQLALNSVTAKKIKNGAVTVRKIGDSQVTTPKLKGGAVTAGKLATGSVITAKIGESQVTSSKLRDASVSTPKIANNAVTTAKILDRAITLSKLAFTLPEPGGDGITRPITPPLATDEIADASVTADKLATDSVTQTKIARNTVGWSEIRTQSLEPEQIKTLSGEPATEGQIPVADLSQDNQWWFRWANAATRPLTPQVATDEIADGAVTPAKLSFSPATGMTPIATVSLLNESSADDIDQIIDLDAYIPAGANFALVQLRTSAGQQIISPTVSEVIWDDYQTEPIFLANLNQGMGQGSVVTQSGPARLYGPSSPARAIRVTHMKNGQIAVTQVYLYGYA